jgi:hypothetical protein
VSSQAFIDVCHMYQVGLGVHPIKRQEMIKAKQLAAGHGNGNFVDAHASS